MTEVTSSKSSWRERGKRANREVEMSTTRRNALRKITFFGSYLLVDICFCILVNISCGGHLFFGDTIRYTIIYPKMVWEL